ncbi:MAG: nucleotidyltransferase domain-containing protein [Firmicutes bacterium]|nr:nucleotidyltransferase domain-containing protein [Candidatus Colivicinus equi]
MNINDLDEYDIRILIADYIDDLLLDVREDEFKYIDMELVGSRINGNNREDSDLDVIVYYSGSVKEDSAFNLLNDEIYRLHIDGIMVDINPKNVDGD